MKTPTDSDYPVFNPPGEIGRRLAYLVYLMGVVTSPLVLIIGLATRRPTALAAGVLSVGITGLCHAWLGGRGRVRAMTREFEAMFAAISPSRPSHIGQLMALLQEWDDLEHQRGMPGFDPWALQSIRRSIHAAITADPDLDRLFHNQLSKNG